MMSLTSIDKFVVLYTKFPRVDRDRWLRRHGIVKERIKDSSWCFSEDRYFTNYAAQAIVDWLSMVAEKVSGELETEEKNCENFVNEGVEKTELILVTNCCSRTTTVCKGDLMMAVSIFISLLVFDSRRHINNKDKNKCREFLKGTGSKQKFR